MQKHKKFCWIIGCRPNYMKVFKHENQVIINTGQHFSENMSKVFTKRKNFPKIKYNLGCKTFGEIIDKIKPILEIEKPDYVIVTGDTNSTLAGALAAKQLNIPVIHIEAGLRSWDMTMPEELNRVIVDKISDYHLAPSETAVKNLEKDGFYYNVGYCGSNMIDSCLDECPTKELKEYPKGTYSVLTLHRQSNVDDENILKEIIEAIAESNDFFVWPIHPRTLKNIKKFKLAIPKNIRIIEPLDHKTMVHLMAFSKKIVTDSGGMQVEAYFLRKPCITIRRETEWVETVKEGWNILTGTNKIKIKQAIKDFNPSNFLHSNNSYGIGDANSKIKNFLKTL